MIQWSDRGLTRGWHRHCKLYGSLTTGAAKAYTTAFATARWRKTIRPWLHVKQNICKCFILHVTRTLQCEFLLPFVGAVHLIVSHAGFHHVVIHGSMLVARTSHYTDCKAVVCCSVNQKSSKERGQGCRPAALYAVIGRRRRAGVPRLVSGADGKPKAVGVHMFSPGTYLLIYGPTERASL